MGTAAYGGKGFKGRAGVSGERPMGAARFRQQHTGCHHADPPLFDTVCLSRIPCPHVGPAEPSLPLSPSGVGLLAAVAATGALLSAMFRRSASSAAALPLLAGLKDAPAELRMVSVSGQEDLAHCAVVRELMKAYIEDTVGLGAPTFLVRHPPPAQHSVPVRAGEGPERGSKVSRFCRLVLQI